MNHNDLLQLQETADLLKIISHPVRLCIVRGLWHHGECNVYHMQSCLQEPQSTISQHLQKLRMAGIVKAERHGVEIAYSLCNGTIKQILAILFPEESKGDESE